MQMKKLKPCSASKNHGDNAEFAVSAFMGIKKQKHNSKAYNAGSDVEINDLFISVKSSRFSLISSALCKGENTFNGIWNIYETKVHSNIFAYVTKDFTCYLMNKVEFKYFVYTFCFLDRESRKNGRGVKIRCRKESKKMLAWLENRAST